MRVAGFGFRSGTGFSSLMAALSPLGPVDAVATVQAKTAGLRQIADHLRVPLLAVSPDELALNPRSGSMRVITLYGTGSVAESAALAAAGQGAVLVVSRTTSPDKKTVVAIAEGPGR